MLGYGAEGDAVVGARVVVPPFADGGDGVLDGEKEDAHGKGARKVKVVQGD